MQIVISLTECKKKRRGSQRKKSSKKPHDRFIRSESSGEESGGWWSDGLVEPLARADNDETMCPGNTTVTVHVYINTCIYI